MGESIWHNTCIYVWSMVYGSKRINRRGWKWRPTDRVLKEWWLRMPIPDYKNVTPVTGS